MGQKHKFRESRMPFPLRDIRKKSSQHVHACAAGDGAICSKNRKIVPYHGANPNTRNSARLRSPSPIMAPAVAWLSGEIPMPVTTYEPIVTLQKQALRIITFSKRDKLILFFAV